MNTPDISKFPKGLNESAFSNMYLNQCNALGVAFKQSQYDTAWAVYNRKTPTISSDNTTQKTSGPTASAPQGILQSVREGLKSQSGSDYGNSSENATIESSIKIIR
jgi:hypothetical protein